MNAYVYILRDPRTSVAVYVGETTNPTRRLDQHVNGIAARSTKKWILELRAKGLLPVMHVVQTVTDARGRKWLQRASRWAEGEWIRGLSEAGAPLLNIDPRCAAM